MKFKKLIFFCILFFSLCCIVFSSESKIIDDENEFGGITIEYLLSADEPQYNQFFKVHIFYDDSKIKQKEIYYISEKMQTETGFLTQTNIFNSGKIAEYIIHLTEKEAAKKGVSILIEKVDTNDNVYLHGYSDGILTAYSDTDSFVNNYPLYSLDYIEKEIYNYTIDKNKKGQYNLSAKYKKARTFVKFSSESLDMTQADRDLVQKFSIFMNAPSIAELYNKKFHVESGGKKYTAYVQDSLIPYLTTPYLTEDGACLLAYGIIGYDGELYLIATEFSEIEWFR